MAEGFPFPQKIWGNPFIHFHTASSLWKRKIWKFPLWAWVIFAIVLLIAGLTPNSNNNPTTQETNILAEPSATTQPTAVIDASNEDWGSTFLATENEVRAYLDDVFAPYTYVNEPFMDYIPTEPNLYMVTTDITLNGNDEAAVKDALYHIENQTQNAPYKFDFLITMLSNDGGTLCVASFGDEIEGYQILADGDAKTYTTIDEIKLGGMNGNTSDGDSIKHSIEALFPNSVGAEVIVEETMESGLYVEVSGLMNEDDLILLKASPSDAIYEKIAKSAFSEIRQIVSSQMNVVPDIAVNVYKRETGISGSSEIRIFLPAAADVNDSVADDPEHPNVYINYDGEMLTDGEGIWYDEDTGNLEKYYGTWVQSVSYTQIGNEKSQELVDETTPNRLKMTVSSDGISIFNNSTDVVFPFSVTEETVTSIKVNSLVGTSNTVDESCFIVFEDEDDSSPIFQNGKASYVMLSSYEGQNVVMMSVFNRIEEF